MSRGVSLVDVVLEEEGEPQDERILKIYRFAILVCQHDPERSTHVGRFPVLVNSRIVDDLPRYHSDPVLQCYQLQQILSTPILLPVTTLQTRVHVDTLVPIEVAGTFTVGERLHEVVDIGSIGDVVQQLRDLIDVLYRVQVCIVELRLGGVLR